MKPSPRSAGSWWGRAEALRASCHLSGTSAALWLHEPPAATARSGRLHSLLTGQIIFSTAFVGACELPNWIKPPTVR